MRDLRIQWLDPSLKVDLLELEPCFRKRVAKYHHPFAKKQSFAAHVLLQEMLKAKDIKIETIATYPNGKWMINDLYVSMTHTKTGVAVMLSDENDSIDMETIRKIDEPLMRHTLCENEQKFLQESRDKDEAFTICWTFKEALIKQLFEEKAMSYHSIDTTSLFEKGICVRQKDTIITVLKEVMK